MTSEHKLWAIGFVALFFLIVIKDMTDCYVETHTPNQGSHEQH